MTKRDRTGTASTEAKRWTTADISTPPAHVEVPEDAMPFWQSIMQTRAAELWTPSDLEFAGALARARAKIEALEREIKIEGDIVVNERGTQIPNPKHSLCETLHRRSIALARAIHIHAEATSGHSRNEKATNTKQRHTNAVKSEDEELLPSVLQ